MESRMSAFVAVAMFLFCGCETSEVITEESCQPDMCELLAKMGAMDARLKATEQQVAILQTGNDAPASPTLHVLAHEDQKLEPEERQQTSLQSRFDDLQTSYNNRTGDRDQLQTRYNSIAEERDQLRTSFDQLQKRCNGVTEERDNLKRRLCESDGFKLDGDQCYYVSTEKRTWEESRQYCRDKQSNLMVINSKEKQDLVERINRRVWLGLTDREEEGSFKWVDGTPLTTPTYWAPGEPDNFGDGDCVTFLNAARKEEGRGWHDASCFHPTNPWICERVL